MTKIAILPIPTDGGGVSYCAVSDKIRSQGATAGAALDALTSQLSHEETGTLVVIQSGRPDRFFDAHQHQRLAELMAQWRLAQQRGDALPRDEQAELEILIDAELRAAARRANALADELKR